MTPGAKLRQTIDTERPVQCVGAINAYFATLAESAGFQALYLSGGGVSAASLGVPDLGISTREDVLVDLKRITAVTDTPVLVDIDTGWGDAAEIAQTVRTMEGAGAAGVHLEDQVEQKRCGHRPNKAIVSQEEMVCRIEAAVGAKKDPDFVIMARTDALAVEGMASAIERASACVEAGADMIFPEAMTELNQYQEFVEAVKVPVLANITEFGATPLFTVEQLAEVGVSLALYPLSTFRAASKAALNVYRSIREEGTQQGVVDQMQTREELYEFLGYHDAEQKLDQLLVQRSKTQES